ncbi:hypothetical protein [Ornithinimicrobium kibberense]|uniref:hypothetical protein n=1 Tax=Ornithinimicrobium kibberense TaxID=282060 RepID=UPI003616EC4B
MVKPAMEVKSPQDSHSSGGDPGSWFSSATVLAPPETVAEGLADACWAAAALAAPVAPEIPTYSRNLRRLNADQAGVETFSSALTACPCPGLPHQTVRPRGSSTAPVKPGSRVGQELAKTR